jgi:3-hydroxyacyl-[acyl-carrier-protein] dehydratase
VTEVEACADDEVVAVKRIDPADPYLSGHYPGFAIYPGVFVIESARQAVAELVRRTRGEDWTVEVVELPTVRFLAPLLTGDTLRLRARCTGTDGTSLTASVDCTGANDRPVAKLAMRCHVQTA